MKIPIEVEDMGRHNIGEIVLSEVEISEAQRHPLRGELRMIVNARLLKLVERKRVEARLPGAMAFRRALQGSE